MGGRLFVIITQARFRKRLFGGVPFSKMKKEKKKKKDQDEV